MKEQTIDSSTYGLAFSLQKKENSDRLMNYFIAAYFIFGLFLSTYYDTWLIGVGVGSLSLIAYYSAKFALPESNIYQYVLSAVVGVFMAQFIYQMHGLFEMHFFAFIGSVLLITFHNWKLQIPLALVVIVHHGTFGYLQYIGMDGVYFTQLDYMTVEVFVYHVVLAAIIFGLCGLWSHMFDKYNRTLVSDISARAELAKQLELKNQTVTDSILYAKRLQNASFPNEKGLKNTFNKFFVLNQQKNIVGGDFYWMHQEGDLTTVVCADCTGHGVPGAFMTIIGINILDKMAGSKVLANPSEALHEIDRQLVASIASNKNDRMDDGMDLSYCVIDRSNKKILYAGAMNPIILVSKGATKTFKGSRFSLGAYVDVDEKEFETQEIEYCEGDMLYLFSDGYIDQFGGSEKRKKFNRKRLTELLPKIASLTDEEQLTRLQKTLKEWQGENPQTDDILVMGMQL